MTTRGNFAARGVFRASGPDTSTEYVPGARGPCGAGPIVRRAYSMHAVLLDSCVWGGAKAELLALGHDVIWSGEWPEDPGDDEILARAHQEGRILVTLDKDFGELAVVRKQPHSGIVRLVGFGARDQAMASSRTALRDLG